MRKDHDLLKCVFEAQKKNALKLLERREYLLLEKDIDNQDANQGLKLDPVLTQCDLYFRKINIYIYVYICQQ